MPRLGMAVDDRRAGSSWLLDIDYSLRSYWGKDELATSLEA
jgi:hypothetical protein